MIDFIKYYYYYSNKFASEFMRACNLNYVYCDLIKKSSDEEGGDIFTVIHIC